MKLFEKIAVTLQAKRNCKESGNDEWYHNHDAVLHDIESNWLPSGSGFDSGTTIEDDKCKPNRIVLRTSYHHMNQNGFYTCWTEHDVWITPTFSGIDISVKGRDHNGIKDYIAEEMYYVLNQEIAG